MKKRNQHLRVRRVVELGIIQSCAELSRDGQVGRRQYDAHSLRKHTYQCLCDDINPPKVQCGSFPHGEFVLRSTAKSRKHVVRLI